MNEDFVDLHIHTNCSDGVFTPKEAVRYACKKGLKAIAITDHDTTKGIDEALDEGKKTGVEIIPGIELAAELNEFKKSEMHILGYYINHKDEKLNEFLDILMDSRRKRAITILEKLNDLNIKLETKEIDDKIKSGSSIGRLHIAKQLLKQGFASTIPEVFQKYLGIGKAAYVPKFKLKPEEAIKIILHSGGIPVLAHPYYGHYSNKNLLKRLIKEGLAGIEVWHTNHSPSIIKRFQEISKELNLIATGGSDCHGAINGREAIMGTLKISYKTVEDLKNYLKIRNNDTKNILQVKDNE